MEEEEQEGETAIFLESSVWVGVHPRAVCVCVCSSTCRVCVCAQHALTDLEKQAEVCRHVCAGLSVCVACVRLCHCVSRVINTAVGAVTRAEKVWKFP